MRFRDDLTNKVQQRQLTPVGVKVELRVEKENCQFANPGANKIAQHTLTPMPLARALKVQRRGPETRDILLLDKLVKPQCRPIAVHVAAVIERRLLRDRARCCLPVARGEDSGKSIPFVRRPGNDHDVRFGQRRRQGPGDHGLRHRLRTKGVGKIELARARLGIPLLNYIRSSAKN
ncbi:hypothetical protein DB459_11860 [Bradyrhizobium sp. WD16]|nr:hypothetical protein DB459_11860 [Bradyrhizobium sp. WD16]